MAGLEWFTDNPGGGGRYLTDAATGLAEVAYDEKKANNDKLVAAVAATGHFTATVATN